MWKRAVGLLSWCYFCHDCCWMMHRGGLTSSAYHILCALISFIPYLNSFSKSSQANLKLLSNHSQCINMLCKLMDSRLYIELSSWLKYRCNKKVRTLIRTFPYLRQILLRITIQSHDSESQVLQLTSDTIQRLPCVISTLNINKTMMTIRMVLSSLP